MQHKYQVRKLSFLKEIRPDECENAKLGIMGLCWINYWDNVLTGLVSQWRRVLTNIKIGVISVNTKQSQQQELGSFVKFVSYWCCLHNTFSDWVLRRDDRNPFKSLRYDLEMPEEVIICLTSWVLMIRRWCVISQWWVGGGWTKLPVITPGLCGNDGEVWKLISTDPVLNLHWVANSNLFSLWIQSSRNSCNNKTLKFSFLI